MGSLWYIWGGALDYFIWSQGIMLANIYGGFIGASWDVSFMNES